MRSHVTPLDPELCAVPGAEDVADVLGVLGEDLWGQFNRQLGFRVGFGDKIYEQSKI